MGTHPRIALDAWLPSVDALLSDNERPSRLPIHPLANLNKPATTMNVYEAAAGLIERCGWRQGAFGSPAVGFCLLGALVEVSGERLGANKSRWAFHTIRRWADDLEIWDPGRSGFNSIVRWNDRPARSIDEVLERLRYAAKVDR